MIDILTNGLLNSPVPIQFTGNYCSHGCVYCFANINNPKRKLNVKAVISQLKNHKKRNDLPSFFMREKYPLLLSNNIDPFSKSNQPFTNDLIHSLTDMNIPVVLATRGGVGWQKISETIKPSVWYVSIPYTDDAIRLKYEPNSPSLSERWDLIVEVLKKGHKVIVSINPLDVAFTSEPINIIKRAEKLGVKSFVVNRLHLNNKQQSNLSDKEKLVLGSDLLGVARSRGFSGEWLDVSMNMFNYCQDNNLNLLGMDTGLANNNYMEFTECYEKLLPTVDNFFNWCWDEKEPGDLIYFDDFYNFFANLLPDISGNISKYIFNRSVINDKDFYKVMSIKNLLHLYWQHPKLNIGLAKNYPSFSWAKKQYDNKLDYIFDDNHNMVLHYNGYEYNSSDSVILK